ncbi:hypothetical protein AVEN_169034-1 [Araneus ventricosus]|uniref:Uncharacterized protein n=1 Tax=Araneus ventricosus TaxID=182803 RepID=A0A4Y2H2V5_ARAVE|nr:hypothetical protein AVEN_169034-1 [Araneus ventricosus]
MRMPQVGARFLKRTENPALASLVKSAPESLSSKEKSNDVPFLSSVCNGEGQRRKAQDATRTLEEGDEKEDEEIIGRKWQRSGKMNEQQQKSPESFLAPMRTSSFPAPIKKGSGSTISAT